jgi:hypothetical protein
MTKGHTPAQTFPLCPHVPTPKTATACKTAKLLESAVALTDDLIANPPAMSLGKLGGMKTAERGPEYFKRIAAMRKTKAGRPRKN